MRNVLRLLVFALLLSSLEAADLTLVNAGGSDHTDAGGNVWSGDTSTRFSGCTAFTNSESIDDTTEDELYQSGVEATSSCSWQLSGINSGIYRIRLLWAETQDNARGTRRFNVTVNGSTIASNLDVFDRVGAQDTAYELSREVAIVGTNITIAFNRVSGDPFINAIEVRRLLEISRGDTLPSTCAVSELFWDNDETAGQNLYGCTSTDTWTQLSGTATVGTDDVGTDELNDTNTPLVGEWVQVDASDTGRFRYRSDAEALTDLGATIVLESDIGSGLEVASNTVHTKSDEAEFLEDVAALSCGAGTKGQLAVVDGDVVLNYCDDAGTPAQHYVALGASDGDALAGDSASSFFDTGTVEAARLPNLSGLNGQVADTQIADGAVDGGTGGEIADGTVDENDLATDSVQADELDASAVEGELEGVLDADDLQTACSDDVPVVANSGAMDCASGAFSTGGTTPTNITGLTDDVAPGAPGSANEVTLYWNRTSGNMEYHLNGETNAQVVNTTETIIIEVFGPTTDTTTGDGQVYFPIPQALDGMDLTEIDAYVVSVGTTGTLDVDLARCDAVATGDACSGTVADMLSTNLTIDSNEQKSSTAATPPSINGTNDDVDEHETIRIDIDGVHTTAAQGLTLSLQFRLP